MKKFALALLLPLVLAACNGGGGPTATESQQPQTEKDKFAACLTEKGAVFYGTEWCPHCKRQKELFGDSMAFINYVDCDKEAAACQKAGITGYPTWKIGEKPLIGTQSLTSLADATGCPYGDAPPLISPTTDPTAAMEIPSPSAEAADSAEVASDPVASPDAAVEVETELETEVEVEASPSGF
jgi:glutaredoxin